MKILDCKQNSLEWLYARAGLVTASELHQLLTPGGQLRDPDAQTVQTYLHKKIAERWTHAPLPDQFTGFSAEQGHLLEAEALPWFALENELTINRVGLITTDDGSFGCSPDGLIDPDRGIELKCPAMHTHVGYVLHGALPEQYQWQVQAAMYVTDRPHWFFCSYRRNYPALVLLVARDTRKIAMIKAAVEAINVRIDRGVRTLEERYGGPSPCPQVVAKGDQVTLSEYAGEMA